MKQKTKFLFFLTRDGVQSRDEGGPEGSRTIGWRGPPPGYTTRWCGPLGHPLTSPFRLYILLDKKTLRARTLFQKTYCKPSPSSTRDQGVQKLFPAPCRKGESPPEAFFITIPASGVMCDVYTRVCSYRQCWASKCRGL
jgi:hypothetical protein